MRYCRFYPAMVKPHIGIIDPRTGELVKSWTGFIDPSNMFQHLLDFLEDNYLLDDDIVSPRKSKQQPITIDSSPTEEKIKSVWNMTESEQLNAALAASISNKEKEENMIPSTKDSSAEIPITSREEIVPNVVKIIKSTLSNNVESGDCIIQIRESNGHILKQSFNSTDPVQSIYDFVETNRTDGKGSFQLMTSFPRKIFTPEMMNKSLLEVDLAAPRSTVIVSLL